MRTQLKPRLILTLALVFAPVVVVAQEQTKTYGECTREPTDGDINAAKGAFQAGQAAFNEADYPKAINYWEDAYRRDCTANALLLNLARAYELNGQKKQAVIALQTYVQREPSSGQRDQIQRRIDVLNTQIAQSSPSTTPSAATAPTTAPTSTSTAPPPDLPQDTGGKKPILPLVVAGVGGVVAIIGGILYLNAASDVSAIEDKCPNRKCTNPADIQEGNDARSRETTAGIVFGAGLAVGVAGVVWYIVSKPKEAASTAAAHVTARSRLPELTPTVGKGFAGLSVSGSF